MLLVLAEVEIPSGGNSLEFMLTEGELKGNVGTSLGIMGKFLLGVNLFAQKVFRQADPREPSLPDVDPFPMIFRPFVFSGGNEIFNFHLLELPRPKDEVTRRNLVTEGFSDLSDAKGNLHPARIHYVLEVCKDSLGGFRTKVAHRGSIPQGTHMSLEHHIEFSWRRQRANFTRCRRRHQSLLVRIKFVIGPEGKLLKDPLRSRLSFDGFSQGEGFLLHLLGLQQRNPAEARSIHLHLGGKKLICAITHFGILAVHHWISKTIHVTRCLPYLRIHDNSRIQSDHVVPSANHILPPSVLDVLPKFNP